MSTTPSPSDSPVIQPMHNPSQAAVVQQPQAPLGNATNGLLQAPGQGTKALLAKRIAAKSINPKYISPTDKMLTPCTKITQAKKKHFKKDKPMQLVMKTESASASIEEDAPSSLAEDATSSSIPIEVDDSENPF